MIADCCFDDLRWTCQITPKIALMALTFWNLLAPIFNVQLLDSLSTVQMGKLAKQQRAQVPPLFDEDGFVAVFQFALRNCLGVCLSTQGCCIWL